MTNGETDKPQGATKGSMVVVFLTVFIDLLGFGLVIPLLPVYADQFAIDQYGWQLGLMMASFSLMQFFFAPIWGNLSDRIGRRPVILIGLASSMFFYFLFALATIQESFQLLLISRFGAGIAGATIPTAQAYIADCTTPDKRAHGMALIGMAFGMGFTFGPLIGFLAVQTADRDPGPLPGYIASGLSLAALLFAIFWLPESLKTSTSGSRRPINWDAVAIIRKSKPLILLFLTVFVFVFSFSKFETTLSLLLKGTENSSRQPFQLEWGQLFLTYALIGFTMALVQGIIVRPLSRRIPESRLALIGIAIEVVGFFVVIGAIQSESLGVLFTSLIVVVTGFSFLQPSINSLVSRFAPPEHQGLILGFSQSVNAIGRILGSGIAIALLKISIFLPYVVSLVLLIGAAILIGMTIQLPFPDAQKSGGGGQADCINERNRIAR